MPCDCYDKTSVYECRHRTRSLGYCWAASIRVNFPCVGFFLLPRCSDPAASRTREYLDGPCPPCAEYFAALYRGNVAMARCAFDCFVEHKRKLGIRSLAIGPDAFPPEAYIEESSFLGTLRGLDSSFQVNACRIRPEFENELVMGHAAMVSKPCVTDQETTSLVVSSRVASLAGLSDVAVEGEYEMGEVEEDTSDGIQGYQRVEAPRCPVSTRMKTPATGNSGSNDEWVTVPLDGDSRCRPPNIPPHLPISTSASSQVQGSSPSPENDSCPGVNRIGQAPNDPRRVGRSLHRQRLDEEGKEDGAQDAKFPALSWHGTERTRTAATEVSKSIPTTRDTREISVYLPRSPALVRVHGSFTPGGQDAVDYGGISPSNRRYFKLASPTIASGSDGAFESAHKESPVKRAVKHRRHSITVPPRPLSGILTSPCPLHGDVRSSMVYHRISGGDEDGARGALVSACPHSAFFCSPCSPRISACPSFSSTAAVVGCATNRDHSHEGDEGGSHQYQDQNMNEEQTKKTINFGLFPEPDCPHCRANFFAERGVPDEAHEQAVAYGSGHFSRPYNFNWAPKSSTPMPPISHEVLSDTNSDVVVTLTPPSWDRQRRPIPSVLVSVREPEERYGCAVQPICYCSSSSSSSSSGSSASAVDDGGGGGNAAEKRRKEKKKCPPCTGREREAKSTSTRWI